MTVALERRIDAVIDAIINRLDTYKADLGGALSVTEGDENPAYIDTLPSIYVIPLAEGKDQMITHGSGECTHTFPVVVVGYYKSASVAAALRTTRRYGYHAISLFLGDNRLLEGSIDSDGSIGADGPGDGETWQSLTGVYTIQEKWPAYVSNPTLECGYWQVNDRFIHYWIATLTVNCIA